MRPGLTVGLPKHPRNDETSSRSKTGNRQTRSLVEFRSGKGSEKAEEARARLGDIRVPPGIHPFSYDFHGEVKDLAVCAVGVGCWHMGSSGRPSFRARGERERPHQAFFFNW